jgi:hypothetical protein
MSARYRENRSLRVLLACSGLTFPKLGLCRFSPQSPGEYLILLRKPPFSLLGKLTLSGDQALNLRFFRGLRKLNYPKDDRGI